MLKAIATDPTTGRQLLMIGLSFGNLDKFRHGPGDSFIKIDGRDTGNLPMDIIIFSGETEAALAELVEGMVGPATRVHVDPRLRS